MRNKRTLIRITLSTMFLLLFLNLFMQMYIQINSVKEQLNLILNQLEDVLEENEKSVAELMASLKDEYIIRAQAASYILEHNISYESNIDELKKVAQLLQVDEIHLFNTEGVLYAGTNPEYFNLTFDSGEQISFFKPMLDNYNLSLCQDLTPNTAVGKNMMYAMVWREDRKGMVQIGQEPDRLIAEQKKNQLSYLFSNMISQPGDTMFILDKASMTVQGSTNKSHIGKTLTELGIELPENFPAKFAFFENPKGIYSYFIFHEYQDYYIGAMRTASTIFGSIPIPMFVVFLSLVVATTIIILGISLYSKIEQKQQTELQTALNKAKIASRSKSSFLFNMSHDIRTPMNAILGLSKVAQHNIDDKEKILQTLKNLDSAGEHLKHLLDDVLDMARIENENENIEFNLQAYHIPTTMSTVESLFATDIHKKNLTLNVSWDVTDEIVFYDKARMEQVELNIISNAIKYTPEGGTITYTFNQVTPAENGHAFYEGKIKDTGVGISKEFQEKMFNAFAREQNSTTSGIPGTGLGLSITKNLLEQMGGSISCVSEPGKGSVFTFRVPFKVGTADDLPKEQDLSESTENNFDFTGKRLLLAEDIELNREIIIELLSDYGLVIEEAEDGLIAVEKVTNASPGYYHLILMDIQMPNMDGYQAAKMIRKLQDPEKSSIPIIAVTANAFEEDRKNAFAAGMNDHVAKPVDLEKLIEALRKYLPKDKTSA